MGGAAQRLGKDAAWLKECRASFEASLREAPQDEAIFLNSIINMSSMPRSDPTQPGRVSKHARNPMQRILAQPRSAFRRSPRPGILSSGGAAAMNRKRPASGL